MIEMGTKRNATVHKTVGGNKDGARWMAPKGGGEVKSLAELESLVRQPMTVELAFPGENGRPIIRKLSVMALRPVEAARVQEILNKAFPPLVRETPDAEPKMDLADAEFQKMKELHRRQARALGVYLGCALFRDGPELTELDKIQEHVERHGTPEMLEMIFQRVISLGNVDVEGRVSFF